MPLSILGSKAEPKRSLIAVASGKGGVGKTTVALNLARAFSLKGKKVGIIDADVYGPSLSKMIREDRPMRFEADGRLMPAEAEGMKIVSVGFLTKSDQPLVLRAPLVNKLLDQFVHNTLWGDCEVIIIDFPPGTGDVQITLIQKAALSGVILVTTPQEVAIEQVGRAASMFKMLKVPLFGIVENMSYYYDSLNQKKVALFGDAGGRKLAAIWGAPLLATLPISPELSRFADLGFSPFASENQEFDPIKDQFRAMSTSLSLESRSELESVDVLGGTQLHLLWRDGSSQTVEASGLLKKCPCANCQGNGPALDGAMIKKVERVGSYALRFVFEKGCSSGIYSFELLKVAK